MKGLFIHDHIFYLIDGKYYSPGGLPKMVWNRYLNHVSSLSVISRGNNQEKDSKKLTLSSTDKVNFNLFFDVKGGVGYYKNKGKIVKLLSSEIDKSDVVIIRMPSTIGLFASEICRRKNKAYITEVVGCVWDASWNYGTVIMKLQAVYSFFKMKIAVKNSYASIYVTNFFLQKRYPNKGHRSYASNVQIEEVYDDVLRKRIERIKQPNNIIKIGIVGNLNAKFKGFDIAFKALGLLKEQNIKFKFCLVGGGSQEYIKSLVKDNDFNKNEVEIIGRLESGKQIFDFLDSLDLYIHPSKQEGLPRAVIEAMSRSCPVLASTVAGIPELLEDEFLHTPGDYKDLFKKIHKVLMDEDILIKMAKTNFKKSKEYTIDVLSHRRYNFFDSVIKK